MTQLVTPNCLSESTNGRPIGEIVGYYENTAAAHVGDWTALHIAVDSSTDFDEVTLFASCSQSPNSEYTDAVDDSIVWVVVRFGSEFQTLWIPIVPGGGLVTVLDKHTMNNNNLLEACIRSGPFGGDYTDWHTAVNFTGIVDEYRAV